MSACEKYACIVHTSLLLTRFCFCGVSRWDPFFFPLHNISLMTSCRFCNWTVSVSIHATWRTVRDRSNTWHVPHITLFVSFNSIDTVFLLANARFISFLVYFLYFSCGRKYEQIYCIACENLCVIFFSIIFLILYFIIFIFERKKTINGKKLLLNLFFYVLVFSFN